MLDRVHYINKDFLMYGKSLDLWYIMRDKYFHYSVEDIFSININMVWSCYIFLSNECCFEWLIVAWPEDPVDRRASWSKALQVFIFVNVVWFVNYHFIPVQCLSISYEWFKWNKINLFEFYLCFGYPRNRLWIESLLYFRWMINLWRAWMNRVWI